jgi:aspartyl-tRNA(Asn)/glutamyl-tRNA(Gln) amidotransferase subunit C
MKITQKDVQYVANLANLELTAQETASMEKDLTAVLDYIDQLSEVDTSSVEPMTQGVQIVALGGDPSVNLRPDEVRDCLPREQALQNAPLAADGFFRVPKVIER